MIFMYHLEQGMSQYDLYDIFAHKLVTCSRSHQRSMILSSSFGITCPSSGRIEIFQNQKSLNFCFMRKFIYQLLFAIHFILSLPF